MTLDDKEWAEFKAWAATKWRYEFDRTQVEVFLEWREEFKLRKEARNELPGMD